MAWRPQRARPLPPSFPPGVNATCGEEGGAAGQQQRWGAEVAAWLVKSQRQRVQEALALRAMPVSDLRLQQRKEREWQAALVEAQRSLQG